MAGCFLRECGLSKITAGLVPCCPDHGPALLEQDRQSSPGNGSQVELRVQIIRQVRSMGQVKRARSRSSQEASLLVRARFGEGDLDQNSPVIIVWGEKTVLGMLQNKEGKKIWPARTDLLPTRCETFKWLQEWDPGEDDHLPCYKKDGDENVWMDCWWKVMLSCACSCSHLCSSVLRLKC